MKVQWKVESDTESDIESSNDLDGLKNTNIYGFMLSQEMQLHTEYGMVPD